MNKSFLYLSSLNKDEINLFEDFLNSPFHNKDVRMVRIFNCIRKFHPDFNSKSLTDEYIFSEVFPGKKFSYSFHRNLMSLFLGLLKKFLLQLTLMRREGFLYRNFEKEIFLLEELHLRNLENEFLLFYNKLYKELSSGEIGLFHFYQITRLVQAKINFHVNKGRQKEILHDLQIRSQARTIHFFNELTLFINDLIANRSLYDYDPNDVSELIFKKISDKEVLEHFENKGYYPDLVRLFVNLINMRLYDEDKYYFLSKELYNGLADKLSIEFRRIIVFYLRAYAMKQTPFNQIFGIETLRWHEEEIRIKNYNPSSLTESLNYGYFISIVKLAVSVNETQWAMGFIKSYIEFVYYPYQAITADISNGILYLVNCNYSEALKYFSRANPQNFEIKCELYMYEFICYLESGYEDSAAAKLDSLRHILRRGDEALNRQKMNLLNNLVRAFGFVLRGKEKDIEKLENFILKTGLSKIKRIEVNWLMEKIKR